MRTQTHARVTDLATISKRLQSDCIIGIIGIPLSEFGNHSELLLNHIGRIERNIF